MGFAVLAAAATCLVPWITGCHPATLHEESFPASMQVAFNTGNDSAKATFTNEYMSLVMHDLPPGGEINIRGYGTHLYAQNDQTLEVTDFEGAIDRHSFLKGGAHTLGSRPCLVRNVGIANARFLTVRRSMRALPSCPANEPLRDSAESATRAPQVLLDTDEFRVLSFVLEPGQSLATISQTAWSLYALNAFTLELENLAAEPQQMGFDERGGYWGVCQPLAGCNLSDTVARFLVFEIKAS